MNFKNGVKNFGLLFFLMLILVACVESNIRDEKPIDGEGFHHKQDNKTEVDASYENIIPEPLPDFLKINDSCHVGLLKTRSRRKSGWNWSLGAHSSTIENSLGDNNCLNYQSVPVEQLIDFLEMHLQQSKNDRPEQVSRFAIDLQLVDSLKNSAIEVVFNLARENPNRKIYYNEIDTEILRPHFQDILDKSSFVEDVCELFARYNTKCVGERGQSLVFQGDYKQFEDLLIDKNAGLASWSQIYFSLSNE